MKLKALAVGKDALAYESKDKAKKTAIVNFINEISSLISTFKIINFAELKIIRFCNDLYLSSCIQVLHEIKYDQVKSLDIFEALLINPIKYEGILLNWLRAYKTNKIRETRYKITQSCLEDKSDRNHPLFYYKLFKKYLDLNVLAEGTYIGISIYDIWKGVGKEYTRISVRDSFFIIQAKSYLRSNIFKSAKKIKKAYMQGNAHTAVKYLFVKYKIEAAKFNQEISKKKFNRIFSGVSDICKDGLDESQTAKILYLMSELYYINRYYEKSLELYKESALIFSKISKNYLLSKKRLLNERLLIGRVKSQKL